MAVVGRNSAATWLNMRASVDDTVTRLQGITIECDDAIKIIERYDSPQTCFYCDPPYPGTDQGHYAGYSHENFACLVEALDQCKGSFVLSCYDQPGVPDALAKAEIRLVRRRLQN
jgi:DNA adenine methylase